MPQNFSLRSYGINSVVAGSPAGGNKGPGTVNATGIYLNGNPIASIAPTGFTMTSGSSLAMTTTYVLVNKTSGSPTTVTLPSSTVPFAQVYTITDQKGDAGTNNITVNTSSGLINGSSSFLINTNHMSASFVYDGTNWSII